MKNYSCQSTERTYTRNEKWCIVAQIHTKNMEEIFPLSGDVSATSPSALLDLELGGLVVKTAGQYYARRVSCD